MVRFVAIAAIAATMTGIAAGAVRAEPPSFDCRAATTRVEVLICNDSTLSSLDADMGRLYRALLQSPVRRAADVRASQRAWLAAHNRCTDTACLIVRTQERIAEMRGVLQDDLAAYKGSSNDLRKD